MHTSRQTFGSDYVCFSHISRILLTRGGLTRIYRFFGFFELHEGFLSPQMGSRSYKNSHRELRRCFIRSEILVNIIMLTFQATLNIIYSLHKRKKALIAVLKKCFSWYIKGCGHYYIIWGRYIAGNSSFGVVLHLSKVLEAYATIQAEISKIENFTTVEIVNMYILNEDKCDFSKFWLKSSPKFLILQRNVKQH